MATLLIKDGTIVNEGRTFVGSILVEDSIIAQIIEGDAENITADRVINAQGKVVIPGVIDDQVHFREPGLTQKADIQSESRAAVAGGVTSYMEMPNTKPATTTQEELAKKYDRAAEVSYANYSFYIGATNDNLGQLLMTDALSVCGVKVFMGSSTGNMLVDKLDSLTQIFSQVKLPIAVHCEDEATIQANSAEYREKYGEDVPVSFHPMIRSAEACYKSTALAVELAKKYYTRLHILHLSTAKELELLRNDIPTKEKRITAEVCVHHLWFCDKDYADKGVYIKWNPSVKTEQDREALFAAMLDGRIDVIATDHAPHLREEKEKPYFQSASGGPLVQHSLVAMLQFVHSGKISLAAVVDRMCHKPAELFRVEKRGFIRQGYKADIAVVDMASSWTAGPDTNLYKCGWSPFDGYTFKSKVLYTVVNGKVVFDNGSFGLPCGERMMFDRPKVANIFG